MALQAAVNRVESLAATIGRAGLNSQFPNDFEIYIIAFELVDSDGNTIEFFSMPILPKNISITEPEITTVKKANKSVITLKSDSFIPKDISLSGDFGRNLKILIRDKITDFKSFKGALSLNNPEFQGPTIKTGYGATKVFQRILEGSKALDKKGKPVKLYFYNFTFNDNYIVEVMNKDFSQSRDSSNLIWQYNVNLKAVAPIDTSIADKKSLRSIVKASILQKDITSLAKKISKSLPRLVVSGVKGLGRL
jgi:hypothetical protein